MISGTEIGGKELINDNSMEDSNFYAKGPNKRYSRASSGGPFDYLKAFRFRKSQNSSGKYNTIQFKDLYTHFSKSIVQGVYAHLRVEKITQRKLPKERIWR